MLSTHHPNEQLVNIQQSSRQARNFALHDLNTEKANLQVQKVVQHMSAMLVQPFRAKLSTPIDGLMWPRLKIQFGTAPVACSHSQTVNP